MLLYFLGPILGRASLPMGPLTRLDHHSMIPSFSTGTYLGGQRPLAALALRKLDGAEGIPHNRVNSHQSLVGTPILSRFLSQSPSDGSEQAINLSEILLRNNFNLRLRRPKTSSGIQLNNSLEVQ
jgi:hypothetical protein